MVNKNEMIELVDKLNKYRDAYYNYNEMLVTDKEYDDLFDKLKEMEEELGDVLPNSPTRTVGYVVQDKLNKVKHSHPMLSLDKTKDINDIIKFAGNMPLVAMCKMDGLTCSLHYDESGNLVSAETRGNGEIGEDVFENAKQITNIPKKIENNGQPLTVDGEVIVDYDTFNKINEGLENKYSHPRNLASGSIRQLDTKITKERNLKFIAWRGIDGVDVTNFSNNINDLNRLKFEVVPIIYVPAANETNINNAISYLKKLAEAKKYPIDGLVFSYNDMAYGNNLGITSHHPRHSMAFKFYDDEFETTLRNIEWNTTRTGIVAPVAVFDEVDLDGALTTRASLSNVSIIKELELGIGDTITVTRRNQVIPHIEQNLTRSNSYKLPEVCPCCGTKLELRKDGIAEILYCVNDDCAAKNLAKFVHFTSKHGMDIAGLSEATLEKFINLGYITNFKSLYHLGENYKNQILNIDGFGKKSFDNLVKSIEKSRNVKLEKFLVALGINLIGTKASKVLAESVEGSWTTLKYRILGKVDFSNLDDFGPAANKSLYNYFTDAKLKEIDELVEELTFEIPEKIEIETNEFLTGKTFVITGAFSKPRKYYEELIVNGGGKIGSSVNKTTNFLLTNDTTSGSSKNKKAAELGIPVMTEEEFLKNL